MAYLYRLVYSWYDDYMPRVLVHEKRFSDEEWDKIIREAMNKAVRGLLKDIHYIGMDRIIDKMVDILCSEHGFRMAEYTHEFELWGSCIVGEKSRDEIKQLSKYLDKELVKAIIQHNKKITERITKSLDTDKEFMGTSD